MAQLGQTNYKVTSFSLNQGVFYLLFSPVVSLNSELNVSATSQTLLVLQRLL